MGVDFHLLEVNLAGVERDRENRYNSLYVKVKV